MAASNMDLAVKWKGRPSPPKPWTRPEWRLQTQALIGHSYDRLPEHPTLSVLCGDTASEKRAEALAISSSEGNVIEFGCRSRFA